MKIVFYHISDIHIEKSSDINVNNVPKMIDVLNGYVPFDKVVIIVTGDIAYSGKCTQYKSAFHMFGTLISGIENKFGIRHVEMCVVPGNHDVDYDLGVRDLGHADLQNKIRNGITPKDIEEELQKQKAYFNYAKGIHCYDETDKLCYIKTIHCGKKI